MIFWYSYCNKKHLYLIREGLAEKAREELLCLMGNK